MFTIIKTYIYRAVTSAIQVYRNKYGITEYAIAGGVTGALYRFNMGPKGWLAGGLVGKDCLYLHLKMWKNDHITYSSGQVKSMYNNMFFLLQDLV